MLKATSVSVGLVPVSSVQVAKGSSRRRCTALTILAQATLFVNGEPAGEPRRMPVKRVQFLLAEVVGPDVDHLLDDVDEVADDEEDLDFPARPESAC